MPIPWFPIPLQSRNRSGLPSYSLLHLASEKQYINEGSHAAILMNTGNFVGAIRCRAQKWLKPSSLPYFHFHPSTEIFIVIGNTAISRIFYVVPGVA